MTDGIAGPSACLDPETLGTLAEGGLAGAARDAAVRHLASCRRCHEVFVSIVQTLDEEAPLPAVGTPSPASFPDSRRPSTMAWLSVAAAALVAAVLFVESAPPAAPRMAEASPAPVVTAVPTAVPVAHPSAALSPEAIASLRLLRGFHSPYTGPPSAGFVRDQRGRAVDAGIADVDEAARALAARVPPAAAAADETADDWRRVGRVLEASRLALLDPEGQAERFFASRWSTIELARASRLLHGAHVTDAGWPDDVRRARPIDGATAQKLLERLDAVLEELR